MTLVAVIAAAREEWVQVEHTDIRLMPLEIAPLVSVIVPAYNAAETLPTTLESLRRQTFDRWEAIVIDDGSRDGTAQVATRFAEIDSRVRVVRQANQGVSHARNTGIERARGVWLLFLDSDDVILPEHVSTLVRAIESHPGNGASFSGWQYSTPDGRVTKVGSRRESGDLFSGFARSALFPIHCCLVRRDLVQQVGSFDPMLRACEDWDLWQRVARTGALFARCDGATAVYQMRPSSLSRDVTRMLEDGLRVIERGFSADPRVARADPRHEQGQQASDRDEIDTCFVVWIAGEVIGLGEDPSWLLERIPATGTQSVTPFYVADALFDGVVTAACATTSDWPLIWARSQSCIRTFLDGIESRTGTPRLAERSLRELERLIHRAAAMPTTIGTSHAVAVELTQPLEDVHVPIGTDRLYVAVEMEGESLGSFELPVFTPVVPGVLIADRIAARFFWQILRRHLEATVYPHVTIESDDSRSRAMRGVVLLSEEPVSAGAAIATTLHDRVGWTVFLQELWGRPDWGESAFYDPSTIDSTPQVEWVEAGDRGWVAVEAGEDIPDIVTSTPVRVVLTVGGVVQESVVLHPEMGTIAAQAIRAALTNVAGLELCRACVREALLGQPVSGASLRGRLAGIARRREAVREVEIHGCRVVAGHVRPGGLDLPGANVPLFARRRQDSPLVSHARLAMIPADAAAELRVCAGLAGEVVLGDGSGGDAWYIPDILPLDTLPAASDPERAAAEPRPPRERRSLVRRVPRRLARLGLRAIQTQPMQPVIETSEPEVCPAPLPCDSIPVLMYHRLSATGADASARYRLDPAVFEEQLAWLRDAGYHSVSLCELEWALASRQPLEGRRVLLTFDDAYIDFAEVGWPLIQRYGFGAVLFVVSGHTGGVNAWDARMGERLPLLCWDALRDLHAGGLAIGAHSATHEPLTGLSPRDIALEAARSRWAIAEELGIPARAFGYPYGDRDEVVEDIVEASGFTLGFTCRSGVVRLTDRPLSLPRIEIEGSDTLDRFVEKLRQFQP